MNKIENLTASRDLLHISVSTLISKLQSAGVTIYAPRWQDNKKIITLDISYFDGLKDIKIKK